MTDSPDDVRSWSLVLASQGIAHDVVHDAEGYRLVVHPRDAERAAAALAAYAQENAPPEAVATPRFAPSSAVAPVAVALGLVLFHLVTGPWAEGSRWFAAGAADAGLIRQGEVWRTVTALTLHADLGHVVSNAVALALFGAALCSVLGTGAALFLVLLGGALANAVGAALRTGPYVGVGASTAVFAAVGLLAGTALATPAPRPGSGRAAIVSGVLLLALLGMNEASDILAHVLGFAVGLTLGAASGKLSHGVPARRRQAGWALVASAVVAASWWLALRTTGML